MKLKFKKKFGKHFEKAPLVLINFIMNSDYINIVVCGSGTRTFKIRQKNGFFWISLKDHIILYSTNAPS